MCDSLCNWLNIFSVLLYNDHLIPTPLVSYRKLSNISGHIWIKITCPDSEMYLSVSAQQEVMILKNR